MKDLSKRLSKMEGMAGINDPGHGKPWHRIIVDDGQSKADAVKEYGIERLGPDDNIIWIQLVTPRFDENGKIVPPPAHDDTELDPRNWREVCGL